MSVDPHAVLQALLRAEASRARRAERTAPEPAAPAPARTPEPTARREDPVHHEDPLR